MTFPGAGAQVYYNEAGEPTGWDYPGYDDGYDPDDYLPDYDDEDFEPDDDEAPTAPWLTVRELQDRLDYLGTPEQVADAVEKLIEYAPIYRDPMSGRIDPEAEFALKAHLIRR
jgi:hypothetical protein